MKGPIKNTVTCLACKYCVLSVMPSGHKGEKDTDYSLWCDHDNLGIDDAEVAVIHCPIGRGLLQDRQRKMR
jgi:hypothetical protein